ncbi:Ig-like domain-containing protein [Streptomyces sp. NPDC101227]|uniref:Ig-like domain-containing protein n=1 Tax=Streptomyces sp. NPDC101227 TaxID=3366136 RepID=UPI0037FC9933
MSQPPSPRCARSRRSPHGALVLASLIGVGALSGCGASTASAGAGNAVEVGLGAASGTRTVQAGDRLRVTASGGVLTRVTVTDPRGEQLAGALQRGDTVWTSRTGLAPATKYSVVARTENAGGVRGEVKESVTTAKAGGLGGSAASQGRAATEGPPDRSYGGEPARPADRRQDGRATPQQLNPFPAQKA